MNTIKEQKQQGKNLRENIPRSDLGSWKAEKNRDVVQQLLKQQESTRLQILIPIRHERMAVSPFTFFRGSAIIQANDQASKPYTDLYAQACGDAHISNFGLFASPERRLIFDINDFDETAPAPFECDVKRLCASIEVCGRERGMSKQDRKEAVLQAARVYRQTMREFSDMGTIQVWYQHIDVETVMNEYSDSLDEEQKKNMQAIVDKALQKNSERAVKKLTETIDGKIRIKSDPPLITPVRDLVGDEKVIYGFRHNVQDTLDAYKLSLPVERRSIIDQYEPVDMAHKVVGIGSVGTQAWILVMMGRKNGDPLVLQIKEAGDSVLEPYFGKSNIALHGQRVVEGQRAIQTAGDILLGWVRLAPPTGEQKDYYVRQLWDAKGSIEVESISDKGFTGMGGFCAWTLAHAHAKTGNRHAIAGYLGKGDDFEKAMVKYASAYADQVEYDYEMFLKMIK